MTLLIVLLCFAWSGVLIYAHLAFEQLDAEDQRDAQAHRQTDRWA